MENYRVSCRAKVSLNRDEKTVDTSATRSAHVPLQSLLGAIVTRLPHDSQAQASMGSQTVQMTNHSKPSPQDDQAPPTVSSKNDVDESQEARQRDESAPSGRTYTVASLLQVHMPQNSLGSYVKAG